MKTVAVVVPTYKPRISDDELISLAHLRNFLGHHDIYYAAPKGLNVDYQPFPFMYFNPKYFDDQLAYSRLLTSKIFFEAFSEYEYILIYQLDCLVFSDQLLKWCGKGFDYIGAPWPADHGIGHSADTTVGNGGFSLRKVSSALKVLEAARPSWLKTAAGVIKSLGDASKFSRPKSWARNVRQAWRDSAPERSNVYEDYFWSFLAKKYYPEFKVAPVSEALLFSFEVDPRWCFAQNGGILPFGCHAWARYDRKFWEPYLIK